MKLPKCKTGCTMVLIGTAFVDRASSLAMGRKLTGNIVNGCEMLRVLECSKCRRISRRKMQKGEKV